MIQRSYQKTKELPKKIPMKCQSYKCDEFDNLRKNNTNLIKLKSSGQKMIDKFIKDNLNIEKKLRENEENIWKYKHSKPPLNLNPWKPANHQIKEFSIFPGDKIHLFKVNKPKKFLITEPYRIPKKDPDYFYQRPSNAINHF